MTDLVRRPTRLPAPVEERESPVEGEVYELLGFMVAERRYAVPLSSVREILRLPPVTEVPRAPVDVLGIISVRGRITTVVDMRRRLRVPDVPTDRQARVLLVSSGDEVMGLLVDRVLSVYRLTVDQLESASAVGGDLAEYVIGVGRPEGARARRGPVGVDDEILILLDPGPLLKR